MCSSSAVSAAGQDSTELQTAPRSGIFSSVWFPFPHCVLSPALKVNWRLSLLSAESMWSYWFLRQSPNIPHIPHVLGLDGGPSSLRIVTFSLMCSVRYWTIIECVNSFEKGPGKASKLYSCESSGVSRECIRWDCKLHLEVSGQCSGQVSAAVRSVQQSHFSVFSPHYLHNTFMIIKQRSSGSVGSSSWEDVCSTQEEALKEVALNLPSTKRQVFFQMSASTGGNFRDVCYKEFRLISPCLWNLPCKLRSQAYINKCPFFVVHDAWLKCKEWRTL